jgi:hypothetical protein
MLNRPTRTPPLGRPHQGPAGFVLAKSQVGAQPVEVRFPDALLQVLGVVQSAPVELVVAEGDPQAMVEPLRIPIQLIEQVDHLGAPKAAAQGGGEQQVAGV